MSDNQDPINPHDHCSTSKLYVALFSPDQNLTSVVVNLLSQECYRLNLISDSERLLEFVAENLEKIDCFVFVNNNKHDSLLDELRRTGILLPTIIINSESPKSGEEQEAPTQSPPNTQNAEITLYLKNINELNSYIKEAIKKFLNLAPSCSLTEREQQVNFKFSIAHQESLVLQQRRLAEKLKERLGYLGVYYKREPQNFFRNVTKSEQQQILEDLKEDYQKIILIYFEDNPQINQLIDKFVNQAFFLDISVPQILEMHMGLMDELAQQLKLEDRSEEILLDYRLTLIDVIAHLCEMYRRSIPRSDVPIDLLFKID